MFIDFISVYLAYFMVFVLFISIIIAVVDVLGFFYELEDGDILESKDKYAKYNSTKNELPLYMGHS